MSYAWVQDAKNDNNATGTTITASITPTAGNALLCFTVASAALSGETVSDNNGNTWNKVFGFTDPNWNGGAHQLDAWYAANVNGGATTVTFNPNSSVPNRALLVIEYSGLSTSGLFVSGESAVQTQTGVSTSADAVSSGNTAALSAQPCVIVGISTDVSSLTPVPSAGTGFTDRGGLWQFGLGVNLWRYEDKRLTSTSAAAATFTNAASAGDTFTTGAVVLHESAGGGGAVSHLLSSLGVGK